MSKKHISIEWQSVLFGMSHRFIIDGCGHIVKRDSRGCYAWYYNRQLYVTEPNFTLNGSFRESVAYVLHTDFSYCYPDFPKADFVDLLQMEKSLVSKTKDGPCDYEIYDGRIAHVSRRFWYSEWSVAGVAMMKMRVLPCQAPRKIFRGVTELDLFVDDEEMISTLLSLFVLYGQNV